ncbi:hypothetical protein JCM31271_31470 [Halorubrum trueperi]
MFHRLRTRARDDERGEQLAEKGKHEELAAYLADEYAELYEQEVERLKEEYPCFWDEEEFTGPVTTNASEGGNWRLKRKLRVPYPLVDTARGRVLLSALNDSLSVYRNGRPAASFSHRHGSFRFQQIMGRQSGNPLDSVTRPPILPVRVARS